MKKRNILVLLIVFLILLGIIIVFVVKHQKASSPKPTNDLKTVPKETQKADDKCSNALCYSEDCKDNTCICIWINNEGITEAVTCERSKVTLYE